LQAPLDALRLALDPDTIHSIDAVNASGAGQQCCCRCYCCRCKCLQAPLDALRLALDPSTIHPIDVALVNREVFMNLATAGPVSEVSSKGMSDTLKKLLGPAAVAVAGEAHYAAFTLVKP
jgi:hypothetical protein